MYFLERQLCWPHIPTHCTGFLLICPGKTHPWIGLSRWSTGDLGLWTFCLKGANFSTITYNTCIFHHVLHHISGSTPPEDRQFQWIKARILAKLKRECAEAVWKLNPKNPVELAQAVNLWEETYGQAMEYSAKSTIARTKRALQTSSSSKCKHSNILLANHSKVG